MYADVAVEVAIKSREEQTERSVERATRDHDIGLRTTGARRVGGAGQL